MSPTKRFRGASALAILATMIATVVIGFVLFTWMQQSSSDHVFERTQAFSELVRVVRPIILLVALGAWRPVFDALHHRSLITDRTHERAKSVWPRLAIWTALIELTLGQGFVLLGLAGIAAYGFYLRLR